MKSDTILVKQHDQSIELRFDQFEVCLLPAEIEQAMKLNRVHAQDGYKFVIIEPNQILMFDTNGHYWPTEDIEGSAAMKIVKLDTRRLLKRATELRAKWLPAYRPEKGGMNFQAPLGAVDLPVAKFRPAVPGIRLMQWDEMTRHKNAEGEMAKTIKHFLTTCIGQAEKLRRDLSHYLECARVFGHGVEFYFDGRQPQGCGFNGGFIIHGNEYSIHT